MVAHPQQTEEATLTQALVPVASSGGAAPGAEAREFRPDVEGLRALAILSVLVYHAHEFLGRGRGARITAPLAWVPGGFLGVDVFFVISGFLITGLLVREAGASSRIHFGRFYARRARRILPAATLTLVATAVAAFVLLPAARAASTASDVLWAALFNADLHFATAGIDYMGVALTPSPVLHFWSLSDEEKFYVVWPAVLAVATLVAARTRRPLRPTLATALAAIAIPSLLWSEHQVAAGAPGAYFSASSRAFELAGGGLLAIAMPWVAALPRPVRAAAPLVGMATVLVCMARYSSLTPFPGFSALPVVAGTVLVLAGPTDGIVARALSNGVPRWFGRISYSLYLWHWPVLVLAAAASASGQLTPLADLLCVAAAILLAWGSYRWVEQPPQRSTSWRRVPRALALGTSAIAGGVVLALVVGQLAEARVRAHDSAAVQGITRTTKADRSLLYIGDSLTTRGRLPLDAALTAAGWDFRIDALGGRPIVSGSRPTWTPNCLGKPRCGADLVLSAERIPGTVVVALGTNAMRVAQRRVKPPTATDSGLRNQTDAQGHYVIVGQDSPADVARQVARLMALVPRTTTVYWIGLWLDDARWGGVTWRESNAAIRASAARFPNARFLDYAAFVTSTHVPYTADGSHPTPDGMVARARWIVGQLR